MKSFLSALLLVLILTPGASAAEVLLTDPSSGPVDYLANGVVASGDGFLAVFHSATLEAFFRVRLDASGVPLDPQPVRLFGDATLQGTPSLVWRGDRWVLVWESRGDVHYAEISAAGELLVRHSPWAAGLQAPRAAWNGTTLLVAAAEPRGLRYALHVLAAAAGGTIASDQLAWTSYFLTFDLGAAGTQFGLVVGGAGHALVRLVGQGSPIGTTVLTAASVIGGDAAVAGLGSAFHVALVRGGESLQHLRVDAAGSIAGETEVYRSSGALSGLRPRLARAGDRVVAAFGGTDTGAALAWGGYVATAEGEIGSVTNPASGLHVGALTGSETRAAALVVRDGSSSIVSSEPSSFAAVLGTAGTALTAGPLMQVLPAVAAGTEGALAAWLERTATGSRVMAARIAASGDSLDRGGIPVGTVTGEAGGPVVAAGHGHYVVVWTDGTRVMARRIGTAGAPLDASAVQVGTGSRPAVVADGSGFLIVWDASATAPRGIFAAHFANGSAATAQRLTTVASATGEFHERPSVAWNGSSYLLGWSLRRVEPCGGGACPSSHRLALLRLDASRSVAGSTLEVSDAAAVEPRIAALSTGEFIVAWAAGGIHVAAARADTAGVAVTGRETVFNAEATLVAVAGAGGVARVFWNRAALAAVPGVALSGLATVAVGPTGARAGVREGVSTPWQSAARRSDGQLLLARSAPRDAWPYQGVSRVGASSLEGAAVLPEPPATPTGVSAVRGGGAVEVRWDPSPGASVYRVEINPGYGFVASVHTVEPVVHLAATAGTTFRVVAINGGGISASSEAVPITATGRRRPVTRPF